MVQKRFSGRIGRGEYMNRLIHNKYFLLTARIILAVVFIFSGIQKISEPAAFAESIMNYKLIPEVFINIASITLPWIELTAGVLLLFGVAVKENAAIISVLLGIFIIAIGISVARGLNIDCGCFGTTGGSKVGFGKIGENLLLLGMGILLIYKNSSFMSLSKED
jgi:putative oxidoreductase